MTPIKKLIEEKKIIICVGSGGVGKTTTSSSIGISGALLGKKVLCITIDPAKRLKDALKLSGEEGVEEEVKLSAEGVNKKGSLHAMILNTKKEMDRIVNLYGKDEDEKKRIINHPFYEKAVTSLLGTMEYASMEKLLSLKRQEKYGLIVLDTPPSSHAIDFLEAPSRIESLFSSKIFRLIAKTTKNLGEAGLKFLRWRRIIMKGLEKFIDRNTFIDILELIFSFNRIFGNFEEHLFELIKILRSDAVVFVVIATPEPVSLADARFFITRVKKEKMNIGSVIINKVHPQIKVKGREGVLLGKIVQMMGKESSLRVFPKRDLKSLAEKIVRSAFEMEEIAGMERKNIGEFIKSFNDNIPFIEVPLFDDDIHDIEGLMKYIEFL